MAEPDPVEEINDSTAGVLLPERPVRGHKGTFGRLLVVAGSLDYAGSALLVCIAAGRAGAGAGPAAGGCAKRKMRIEPARVLTGQ